MMPFGRGTFAALVLVLMAGGASADEGDFAACVARLQGTARDAGISERVVDEVLGRVTRQERVLELDRKQPEFTLPFTEYYNRRVTPERVARGRGLLAKHAAMLRDIERDFGVPAKYLVAFWGLETNFGSNFGDVPVPDSLTTLACDTRRSAFFTAELLEALRIVDAGDIPAARMKGSWAGAMGHVQFMPSIFQHYAVDADHDGRRDLWSSIHDAMASAANFLRASGWERGLLWGREVRLPRGFDYLLAGRDQKRPLSEWAKLGVTDASGGVLPDLTIPAALLVPSGHAGPAFLTYGNFDVIMRWNRSEFYALSVGRLADEIAGAGPLSRPPPANAIRISRERVLELQSDLNALGYDVGKPDGIVGPVTRRAVSRFQQQRNMVADGHLDAATLEAVRSAAVASGAPESSEESL
ncbi:MAG TPA: lytic murein transglycosylase [Burkholderiales bacterium]|nr:lytic murein transglycosylase [Burkholderiales bacterium]